MRLLRLFCTEERPRDLSRGFTGQGSYCNYRNNAIQGLFSINFLKMRSDCSFRALLQVQPELIAARLAPEHTTVKPETQKKSRASQNTFQSHQGQAAYLWRLTLPPWMCSKALELSGMRVPAGWNWSFRVYNLIPATSEVVERVLENDIKGLQELFTLKQATPFDRISSSDFFKDPFSGQLLNGDMTLLHVNSIATFTLLTLSNLAKRIISTLLICQVTTRSYNSFSIKDVIPCWARH